MALCDPAGSVALYDLVGSLALCDLAGSLALYDTMILLDHWHCVILLDHWHCVTLLGHCLENSCFEMLKIQLERYKIQKHRLGGYFLKIVFSAIPKQYLQFHI